MALAFYVVMARRLGPSGLGEFTFALSLIALMLLADTAIDDILARDVARDQEATSARTANALSAKLTVGGIVGLLAIALTFVGGYSWTVRGVVFLMVIGSLPELAVTTLYAILRGLEDFRTGTVGLGMMRLARAVLGIAVLLAGGGVLAAAGAYAAGGFVGFAFGIGVVGRRPGAPRIAFKLQGVSKVLGQAWRLAAAGALDTILVSAGPIALAQVKGARAIGAYGAGIRLALVAQFVSVALATAALPVMARSDRRTTPSLGEVVESTLKAATATALPVTAFLALFAAPVVHVIYGHQFGAAVTPTRLLAGLVALRALTFIMFVALLAHDRLVPLVRIPAFVLAGQVILLAVLVPTHGTDGAAAALLFAEVGYAVLMTIATLRLTGGMSLVRIGSGPLAGALAMCGVAALLGTGVAGIVVGTVGCLAVLGLWERAFYPADLARVLGVRSRRCPSG
jgi:O-antigen/teichoic acid export membrane protein